MHDFYERVAQYDCQSIVMALVRSRVFSLEAYNASLKGVKLSDVESADKPLPVKAKSEKLSGKAMSVALHVRLMPLVISRIVDFDNDEAPEIFNLLVLLHKINEFMLMDIVAPSDVATFQELLIDYFRIRQLCVEKYGKLFGNITAKYHFLEHYAEQLLLFGPLTCVWTARYESKHREFVNYLESSKNHINMLKTLATKHQKRLAARCYTGMFHESSYSFPAKLFTLSEGLGNFLPSYFHASDLLTDKVIVRNTKYKIGQILVTKAHCYDEIEVGVILKVVFRAGTVMFLLEMFNCQRNKFQIFETTPLNIVTVLPYISCVDFKPIVKREEGDDFTFVLHHRFPGRHIPFLE